LLKLPNDSCWKGENFVLCPIPSPRKSYRFLNNYIQGIFIRCHLTTGETLDWFWSNFTLEVFAQISGIKLTWTDAVDVAPYCKILMRPYTMRCWHKSDCTAQNCTVSLARHTCSVITILRSVKSYQKAQFLRCASDYAVMSQLWQQKEIKRRICSKQWLLKKHQHLHISLLEELRFCPRDWYNYIRMTEETLWLLYRWGETTFLNCDHQWAYCSSLRWYTSLENYAGMIRVGKTPESSTRALWQSCQQSHLIEHREELAKYMPNLASRISLSYFKGFFNMPKNLRTWGLRLYFSSEGRCVADFIAL
jgi:hypothetical protein